jgi:bcr-type benzoyl-CoA reductase subunit C
MIDALIHDINHLNKNKWNLLKENKKPKIGWLSIYTPEEIIHAAGMIPYHITGESKLNFPKASTHMHSNLCPYVLSSFEEVLDGVHDFAKGTIFVNACDARRRMYDVYKHFDQSKFLYLLDFSKVVNINSKRYFRLQLQNLIFALENYFHCKITNEALHEAIKLWNKTRNLLSELYEYRRTGNADITGSQAMKLVKASMIGLKEEFNIRLSRLLDQIKKKRSKIKPENRYRILLCGSYFDHMDIAEIIESYGAYIVCENISVGLKYFEGQVDTTGDPLDALADYYLEKATCARMIDFDRRVNNLLNLVESYNIQSVVFFALKFCDNNLLDFPLIKKKLNERSLPVFFIEAERSFENIEQIKTRIIAFLESQMGYVNTI